MHPLRRLPEHLSGGRDRLEKDQENPAVACTYGKRVRTIREPVGAAAKSSVETSICTTGGSGAGKSDEELHKNVKGDVKWEKGTQIN